MTLKIFAHFTARCYAERCIATASRPSVTLRYRGHIGWNSFENNLMADLSTVFTLCRHQHHGSTPKGTLAQAPHGLSAIAKPLVPLKCYY